MISAPEATVRIVRQIAGRPWIVVGVMAALTALALAVAFDRLRIDTSTDEMLSADIPFRQHRAAYLEAFPDFDATIVAVIDGPTPERVERAATALAEALRADPTISAVDHPAGEPFLIAHGLLYLEAEALVALTDRLAAAQPVLAALAADPNLRGLADFLDLALSHGGHDELSPMLDAMAAVVEAQRAGRPDQLSWQQVFQGGASDGPVRQLVIAQPVLDHASLAPAGAAIAALRGHAERLGIGPEQGLTLGLTGAAVLDQEELASVSAGAVQAGLISLIAVAALLVWGLGSARLIAATLITLVVGLILTAGLATLTIGRLNLISVAFAVLFVGLGVDFGIHLVLRYREALAEGSSRDPALERAVAGVGGPLSLSALAAALGFLAFVPTDYLGLAELGVISASGMGVAWATSLTLLPALLVLLPPRAPARAQTKASPPTRLVLHPRLVLAFAAAGALVAVMVIPILRFDFNPLNLKDPASESMRTFDTLAENPETAPQVIDLLAGSLAEADALAAGLAELPEVAETATLSRFVPPDQDDKLALIEDLAFTIGPSIEVAERPPLDPAARAAALARLRSVLDPSVGERPEASERLARALDQLLAKDDGDAVVAELERRLLDTLTDLLDRLRLALAAEAIAIDGLPERIQARWLDPAGRARVLVRPEGPVDDDRLRAFTRAVLAVAPAATGMPVFTLAGADAVVAAFVQASGLALAAISLLLSLVLRRVSDVLLVLAPLGLAILLTGGSAVLLGLSLNFANVIVLPLLLGLGVSGAIHVVMRWREEGRSTSVALTSTPRAVLFSALTTVASFGSLALSDHRGLASMGLLLTIAILWSLVCNLVVLPSLLTLLGQRPAR